MAKQHVIVSERALFQRLNRKLQQDERRLCTARNATMEANCGRYYIVDTRRNAIAETKVDLQALGRELGILKPWEVVG